ncbi:unnamed protein product, partial [Dibothriocephalus latus]
MSKLSNFFLGYLTCLPSDLDAIFDLYLRTLPKLEIPLRLPTPDKYKFTRPDTSNVIVFEQPSLTPSIRSPNLGSAQAGYADDLLEDDLADLGLTDEEDMFAL